MTHSNRRKPIFPSEDPVLPFSYLRCRLVGTVLSIPARYSRMMALSVRSPASLLSAGPRRRRLALIEGSGYHCDICEIFVAKLDRVNSKVRDLVSVPWIWCNRWTSDGDVSFFFADIDLMLSVC